MKRMPKKRWRRNGGLKIGGGSWKAETPISWVLEIAIPQTIHNLKNGSVVPPSFWLVYITAAA
jgi:hypothetical protein